MSSYNVSKEEMAVCPYNKSHRMFRKHLQPHLIKCKLNYPEIELMKCPFNSIHLLREDEFNNHVKSCPDKIILDSYKYKMETPKNLDVQITAPPNFECDDNWDDIDVGTYNPEKYAASARILRSSKINLSEEKKKFRKSAE